MPSTTPFFGLPPLPSKAQLRFEERYAEPLGSLRRIGFSFGVSPFEALAPSPHYYPGLVRHVEKANRPWRWVSVSHETAGLLGQLALFSAGTLRDDSGTSLDATALLVWTTQEMKQAGRRTLHQNRLTLASNELGSREARRALPWVRAGALLMLLGLGLDAGQGYAQSHWLLPHSDRSADWLTLSGTLAMSFMATQLSYWWWQLRKRLAMDKA